MAQLVQLEEVFLHAVIFKMRGYYPAVRVVRRVLDRAEVLHLHVLRDDHQAAGVLARRALYAHKAHRQPALFGL